SWPTGPLRPAASINAGQSERSAGGLLAIGLGAAAAGGSGARVGAAGLSCVDVCVDAATRVGAAWLAVAAGAEAGIWRGPSAATTGRNARMRKRTLSQTARGR